MNSRTPHAASEKYPQRTVLVTGGSRGIGLAIAQRLHDDGHRVAVTYNTTPPADHFFGVHCDVSHAESVNAAFAAIENELGPVDVAISNAGITQDMLLLRMDEEKFANVINTNLTGAYRVAKRACRHMLKARWGRLIFVGSVVGMSGTPGQANYAASKAGTIGLARSLARELGSRSITSNVIAPGFIDTDMTRSLDGKFTENIHQAIPLTRIGKPEEVAAVASWLVSEDSRYVTGAVIPVDGGLGMGH